MDKEKLDLLSALKEDKDENTGLFKEVMSKKDKKNIKKKRDKEIKEARKKASEKRDYQITETEEQFLKDFKAKKKEKRKKNYFLYFLSFLTLLTSITYTIYIVVKGTHLINQPQLMIESIFLLLLVILLLGWALFKQEPMKQILSYLSILGILLFIGFELLVSAKIINLPTLKTIGDFTEVSVNQVIKWANENHVTLEQTYEYSDSIENNYIIRQNLPADTLVKDIKKLEVVVSNGPNLESIVNVPNMIGWNVEDVVKKIEEKKLSNVQISFVFNETIARDILYEQNKSGDIRRNEELVLTFSLGKEADLKPVELKDLIGKKEFDATLWLKRNGISYKIAYEFSDTVERGTVISTDPVKGTTIQQKETTVQLIISKGPKITAPDFMKMSLEEITKWAIQYNMHLSYDTEYSDTIKAGDIIRVSVEKGAILEEGSRIYIVTSKGALKMISYTDGDINSLRVFASEHNITLTESEDFSDTVEKGKFISINYQPGAAIQPGSEIQVQISLGKAMKVPNFIGMTNNSASNSCKSSSLDCTFSYVYSSKTKGTVIYQNKEAGSNVVNGTNIVLTISNGPRPSSNNNNDNHNSNSNNNNNNNNSSNNNEPVTPPTPTCENYTLRLGAGSSVEQTKSIISQLNPKGKIVYQTVNPGYGTTGSLRNDMFSTYQNTTHTSCETITIYIIDRNL